MYKQFFGLRENPFNLNPDPRFLHFTPQIQEAIHQLTFGIQNRKGLILLTGEVGTGKTTIINYLLGWLRHKKMNTAFIFNSHLSVNHFLEFMLNDFGIPRDSTLNSNMVLHLNRWLLERFRAGETSVLIFDEAHGAAVELLEEIRLLLNLETASEKLLQIVLVGQPELEEKLRHPDLRQLCQRIALRSTTAPLTLEQTCKYIVGRSRISGATANPIFTASAMEAVYFYSHGIPRVINLLCEHALINAYVEQIKPVPTEMVEQAARDILFEEFRPFHSPPIPDTQLNNTVSGTQSILANSLERGSASNSPFAQALALRAASAAPAFVSPTEPALPAQNTLQLNLYEPAEREYSAELRNTSAFMGYVGRDLPVPIAKDRDGNLSPNAGAPSIDPVVPPMSELAPKPTPDPLNAKLHALAPKHETAPFPRVEGTAQKSVNRAIPLDAVNRLEQPISHPVVRSALASPADRTPAVPLFRRWRDEFQRDWNYMLGGLYFPGMKKSISDWLRQPVSSKPLAPRKD